jgi:L-threonylcarbamoyladenylate synthase
MSEPAPPPSSLAAVIAAGGAAVIPTDTVYGLCCDAGSEAAVKAMLALKGRPAGKPAAVAFFSLQAALDALPELHGRTRAAVCALLPGPLTLLVPNPAGRFPLSGGTLLGIRVIEAPLQPGRPLLLTSANLAGGGDPRTPAEIPASIAAGVALVIDGGELPGTPSTVVDLGELEATGRWRIVRAGALPRTAVQRALVGS